jgi:hypothetical protein
MMSQIGLYQRRDSPFDFLDISAQMRPEIVGEEDSAVEVPGALIRVLRCQVLPCAEALHQLATDLWRNEPWERLNARQVAFDDMTEPL